MMYAVEVGSCTMLNALVYKHCEARAKGGTNRRGCLAIRGAREPACEHSARCLHMFARVCGVQVMHCDALLSPCDKEEATGPSGSAASRCLGGSVCHGMPWPSLELLPRNPRRLCLALISLEPRAMVCQRQLHVQCARLGVEACLGTFPGCYVWVGIHRYLEDSFLCGSSLPCVFQFATMAKQGLSDRKERATYSLAVEC